MNKSFADYETAFVWSKYQEMLLTEPESFDANPNEMYTILDILLAKYGENSHEFTATIPYFKGIENIPLSEITYKRLLELAKKLLLRKVCRGGKLGTDSGHKKLPEPMTVLRKFAYLSSAIGFMSKKGIQLENNALKVVAYLREIDRKVKNGKS